MAAALEVQLEGTIRFCTVDSSGVPATGSLTDYSSEISSLVINRSRTAVVKPATFASAKNITRAGALEESVTLNFFNDETVASAFWALLWTAIETSPCEVYFDATYKTGSVSATNPRFTGYLMVGDLDTGGSVSEYKQQSKTWAARGIAKSNT